jgi:acetyl-CoA carboxylase biotin carboxyl carrier protein
MDSNEIRELIELISRSNFKRFELEREGFRLKLVKCGTADGEPGEAVRRPLQRSSGIGSVPEPLPPAEAPGNPGVDAPADGDLVDLNSPIVGTFYAGPNPDAPPFVEVGTRVKKGQVTCIVEAMKVMNEIESEIDGEIVEVLVSNGQPVEYGEVLFRLRPDGSVPSPGEAS